MNTKIEQVLSSGKIEKNFKVGDIPYSAMCDYMSDCTIKCSPDATITKNEINPDTYDEKFIQMNSEKITSKIRALLKEEFFYKKSVLFAKINHPKTYPLVEIYSALTQLIDDATEQITDKYGRTGRLVNIGEYYIFRPIELTSKNVDTSHIKIPIDYKNTSFVLKRKEGTPQVVEPKIIHGETQMEAAMSDDVSLPKIENVGQQVLQKIEDQFSMTMQFTTQKNVERGDKTYYKHLGVSIKKIHDVFNTPIDTLKKFIVYHSVDTLLYTEKTALLNYVFQQTIMDEAKDYVTYTIKTYFDKFVISDKGLNCIVFYENKERHILILNKRSNTWVDAEEEDKRDLSVAIKNTYTIPVASLNDILGFIGDGSDKNDLVFKTQDRTKKRTTGTRCEQATKSKNISILNRIIGEEMFSKENILPIVDVGVCCLQEILMRMYNEERSEHIWFLSPDTAKMLGV
jgi:hypothetical protein